MDKRDTAFPRNSSVVGTVIVVIAVHSTQNTQTIRVSANGINLFIFEHREQSNVLKFGERLQCRHTETVITCWFHNVWNEMKWKEILDADWNETRQLECLLIGNDFNVHGIMHFRYLQKET